MQYILYTMPRFVGKKENVTGMYFLGQKPSLGWGSSWSETPDAEVGSLEQGERGKKPQKQDHLGWKRPVIYKDLQEVQAAKQTWQSFRLSGF